MTGKPLAEQLAAALKLSAPAEPAAGVPDSSFHLGQHLRQLEAISDQTEAGDKRRLFWEKKCGGKTRYATHAEAAGTARLYRGVVAYLCPLCRRWHIGQKLRHRG